MTASSSVLISDTSDTGSALCQLCRITYTGMDKLTERSAVEGNGKGGIYGCERHHARLGTEVGLKNVLW